MSKNGFYCISKRALLLPLPLYMKGWGTLAPLCPSPLRRAWVVLLIVWHGNYTLTFIFIAWVNLVMEI